MLHALLPTLKNPSSDPQKLEFNKDFFLASFTSCPRLIRVLVRDCFAGGRMESARKWLSFVASVWIMAISATNFDFSIYSSHLKQVLDIDQMELNNLAVASDLGKLLGWVSGFACLVLPPWAFLAIAAALGFISYGIQWLVVVSLIPPVPYELYYVLCMVAGNSICWLNTICFRVAISNFPSLRGIAAGLNTSYSGLSTVIFTILASIIAPTKPAIYLLLNAVVPVIFCCVGAFLISIPREEPPSSNEDLKAMYLATFIAIFTALYSIAYNFLPHNSLSHQVLFLIVLALLLLSLIFYPLLKTLTRKRRRGVQSSRAMVNETELKIDTSKTKQAAPMNLSRWKRYVEMINRIDLNTSLRSIDLGPFMSRFVISSPSRDKEAEKTDETGCRSVGEEHSVQELLTSLDFWLYYFVYLCGATVSLVFINNMGQIIQSLGYAKTPALVSLLSSANFLGRIASGLPDYSQQINSKVARTAWLGIWTAPMVPTLFMMAYGGGHAAIVYMTAAIMGWSSGAVTSVAVPVTSELFGSNRFCVNHNIMISNIAVGSLVFGNFAGFVYDRVSAESKMDQLRHECLGTECYRSTLLAWGAISFVGCLLSVVLWIRTRSMYRRRSSRLLP